MTDVIQFFIEKMSKGVIGLTCAGMVNILKHIPGVQGVDKTPYPLEPIPDELKTLRNIHESCIMSLISLKHKRYAPRSCATTHAACDMFPITL